MSIFGDITLEDVRILFEVNTRYNTVNYRVYEHTPNAPTKVELFEGVPQAKFFKALSIAVHNDGTPDYNIDYPDAESIMGEIRWIP